MYGKIYNLYVFYSESASFITPEILSSDYKQIDKYINEFLSLENLVRELIINLVEKIYIYQDKQVDIIFTFKNVT